MRASFTDEFVFRNIGHFRSSNNFLKKEVASRVVALGTSAFAALDAAYHGGATGITLFKLTVLCAFTDATWSDAWHHASMTAVFALEMLLGSIVVPFIVHEYDPSPRPNPSSVPVQSRPRPSNFNVDTVPDRVSGLTPRGKKRLVRGLSCDTSPEGKRKRQALAKKLFRATNDSYNFKWKSNEKLLRLITEELLSNSYYKNHYPEWAIEKVSERMLRKLEHVQNGNKVDLPGFYHATRQQYIWKILKNGEVKVMHSGAYKGAFVSTQPEYIYGQFVFAFDRSVVFKSKLMNGYKQYDGQTYWSGLSKPIKVYRHSKQKPKCVYIILQSTQYKSKAVVDETIANFKQNLQSNGIIGMEVVSYQEAELEKNLFLRVRKGKILIPKEWPDSKLGYV